jgi:hypothetical protein
MVKLLKYIVGAALAVGSTVAVAGDLPPEFAESVMNDCRPDYHRVCAYVVPGDGRVARCLLDHERDLAPQCLKAIKLAYAVQVCLPDYRRFCPGVPQGQQAVECLAARIDALIPECQRVVSANAPYLASRGDRFSYNRESGPYSGPYPRAYSFGERQRDRDYERYPDEVDPRDRRYGDGPYSDEGGSRFRSYDDRYADRTYGRYRERPSEDGPYRDRGYGDDQRSPYGPEEEREPVK